MWIIWGLSQLCVNICFLASKLFNIFIYVAVPCLSCGMWDLVPWPGNEPGPPASGVQSLSHWTTMEVLQNRKFSPLFSAFLFCGFLYLSSQVVLVVKNPPANAGDTRDSGLIPGSGRSPGVGNGNLLQYSCLENP